MEMKGQSLQQRIHEKIYKDKSGCHLWTSLTQDGTPLIWKNQKMVAVRPLIDPVFAKGVCYMICGKPSCVNPNHLGTLDERVWKRLEKRIVHAGECWEVKRQSGKWYDKTMFRGKGESLHRIAYMLKVGRIPAGMCVCHHCDNPKCIRTDHLFVGTRRDNVNDCVNKNRHTKGEKMGGSKLTEASVRFIRSELKRKVTGASLALKFNVTPTLISKIKKGALWKHV